MKYSSGLEIGSFSLLDLKSGVGDFDLGNLASITVLFYFILHVPIDVPPGI